MRGRGEDAGYVDTGLRMEPCIGRRKSDSVMDLERPGTGDGGVPKLRLGGRIIAGIRFPSSHPDREGSAVADSDVSDDCESAKRLLPPWAEDGDVTGLDWALGLRGDLREARMRPGELSGMSACREADLCKEWEGVGDEGRDLWDRSRT